MWREEARLLMRVTLGSLFLSLIALGVVALLARTVALWQEGVAMNIEYLIMGVVSLAVAVYLAVALLRPDKF